MLKKVDFHDFSVTLLGNVSTKSRCGTHSPSTCSFSLNVANNIFPKNSYRPTSDHRAMTTSLPRAKHRLYDLYSERSRGVTHWFDDYGFEALSCWPSPSSPTIDILRPNPQFGDWSLIPRWCSIIINIC